MSQPTHPILGFHCSHEQHSPGNLLALARAAEAAGFRAAMCSDHFHPWTERQGQSGHAWSWLGAALQATALSLGTVCAPGQRYHPAVIAQAAATLAEMFPGRFWVAVGSGEALNEAVTGTAWPPKPERQRRLEECAAIMRALWAGDTVTHGGLVRVKNARLYSRPSEPPLLVGAALTEATARWVGAWADALITVAGPREAMRRVVEAFREGGREGKPMFVQVVVAKGRDDEESAQAAVAEWPQCALSPGELADLETPAAFEHAIRGQGARAVLERVRATTDVERQLAWLQEDAELGFDRLYLHNVTRDHQFFFRACRDRILPAFAQSFTVPAAKGRA